MRSERTKACDISQKVKFAVWMRDGERCIICGSHRAMPNSHYIKRSQGGLGIEENITTMCLKCHDAFDGAGREINAETFFALKKTADGECVSVKESVAALKLLDFYISVKPEENLKALKELLKICN